ncbi:MAG: peptidyl-prolyl cis-trans isomerase [Lentisphaerota bacterium]
MKYFLLTIFLFAFLFSANAKDENIGVLATVNGSPITLTDVLEISSSGEAQLPMMYKGKELNDAILKLRKEVLELVIDRKLVYEDFKAHDFKLPREFVENNMDQLLKSYHLNTRQELESMLRENGKTFEEFKSKAYESMATEALIYGQCYKDAFVTPKDVYDYYQSHKSDFTSASSVKLRVLTLKKKGAHEQDAVPLSKHLEKKLKGKGEDEFVDAVSLYSDGPNLKNGGELSYINLKDLRKEFAEVITEYKEGLVYGPIDSDDAIYFFMIKDFKEAHIVTYEEAKDEIKKRMMDDCKRAAYKSYVAELRKQAYIQYFI